MRRLGVRLALLALLAWYGRATLPHLGDFPVVEYGQMRILAPAYQLATRGVYGNDLLTGFYHAERVYHEYMPLYPLLAALAMKVLGPSLWAARMASVLAGLLTVVLTYRLGRDLDGPALGLLAAAALCVVKLAVPVPGEVERIGIEVSSSGIPLLDLARVVRFDIWVPVWGLGACCLWLAARRAEGTRPHRAAWADLGAGACVGLATLTHVYGIFFLPLFGLLLVWEQGWGALRRPALYRLLAGFGLVLLPWAAYVAQDWYAFRGQMQPQAGRFDLLNPSFYLDNLLREPWRYLAWIGGGFRRPVLWPRLGVFVMAAGAALTTVILAKRAWEESRTARVQPAPKRALALEERFLLVALPLLGLLLGALISFKRYYYVLLVLPFLALHLGYAARLAWRWAGKGARLGVGLGRGRSVGLVAVGISGGRTADASPLRAKQARMPGQAGGRNKVARVLLVTMGLVLLVEGAGGVGASLEAARAITPYQAVTGAFAAHLPAGASLLIAEPMWLGLRQYEARSILLAFLLADERYYDNPRSIETVLGQLDPDYVLAQDYLLNEYLQPGAPFQNPVSLAQWTALRDFLGGHCPQAVFRLDDKDYGRLSLYRCKAAGS